MKQICTSRRAAKLVASCKRIGHFIAIFLFVLPSMVWAQPGNNVIPELVFQNPVLVSGNNKQEGAIYRFCNVANGIDALLEIKKISDNSTVVNTLDLTSSGWNKAFQPEIGRSGRVSAFQNWWVRFRISFVKSGTNDAITLSKFYITALDVDGDNVSIQEYVQMQKADSIKLSPLTNLLLTSPIDCGLLNSSYDKLTQGPIRNFTSIDTAATLVMATYTYLNVNEFDFTIGARSGAASSSAGLRLNSLWFKSFSLTPQQTLPLQLMHFQGNASNGKADLQWTVAENETGSAFELERSTSGSEFKTAALIFTTTKTGIENYSFKETIEGTTFYRLKMINRDNSISYSKIIRLSGEQDKSRNQISLLENPVTSGLQFSYTAASTENSLINIYNITGVKLYSTKIQMHKGVNSVQLNLNSKISTGTYLLEIINNNESSISRFIKK